MAGVEIRYATTSLGARIAYGVAGSGPAMILLPITPSHGIEPRFDQFADALDRHVLVTYDHVGSGHSDRDNYDLSPQGRLDELESVVRDVASDRHVVVAVGHGGPTAIRYAAKYPERVDQLVLANTFASGTEWVKTGPISTFMSMLGGDPEPDTIARTYARVLLGLTGEDADRFVTQFTETVSPEVYLARANALGDDDATPLLAQVTAPTLILQGTEDMIATAMLPLAREMAAGIRGARLELIPDLATLNVGREIAARLAPVPVDWAEPDVRTILFTDLEASTPLTQRLGDEGAQEILRGHNKVVREALDEHGGREVKHLGDGIMASFPSAVSAVTAALQIQRGLAGGEVRVRVGLNAGEPIAEDDDLFGLSVIKAARIADRAEPGQVLVSNVVMELCEGKTFEFASLGAVSLKGFDEAVTLFEVVAP